ncbi:hypothetical protein MTR67_005773 [Solanum verrucosum]|uniref:Uncharacterized protein n=1 Tax=Solanum verrucosum TaxID=315347 RepID=A0AAF0PWN8_SOLVR|nr:hypothetical protein MTR67_005773 [Solanum verrucosum]
MRFPCSGESPELIKREGGLVTAFSNKASGEVGDEQPVEEDKAGDSISVDNGKVQQEPDAMELDSDQY